MVTLTRILIGLLGIALLLIFVILIRAGLHPQ